MNNMRGGIGKKEREKRAKRGEEKEKIAGRKRKW